MHLSAVWFPHNWSKSLPEFIKKWRHKFIYSISFCGMLWLVVELSSTLNIGISVSGFARVAHDWMCQKRGLACLDFGLLKFLQDPDLRRSCNSGLNHFGHHCCQVRSVAESRPSFLGECMDFWSQEFRVISCQWHHHHEAAVWRIWESKSMSQEFWEVESKYLGILNPDWARWKHFWAQYLSMLKYWEGSECCGSSTWRALWPNWKG